VIRSRLFCVRSTVVHHHLRYHRSCSTCSGSAGWCRFYLVCHRSPLRSFYHVTTHLLFRVWLRLPRLRCVTLPFSVYLPFPGYLPFVYRFCVTLVRYLRLPAFCRSGLPCQPAAPAGPLFCCCPLLFGVVRFCCCSTISRCSFLFLFVVLPFVG